MKTVYKKIAVVITALFVISLSFLPFEKKAEAADINEPQPSTDYIFTKIGISERVRFAIFGATISPAYVFDGLTFNIFNTTTFSTGATFTYDSLNTTTDSTGGRGNINLISMGPADLTSIYTFYLPPLGSSMTITQRWIQFNMYYYAEYSSTISGQITSYSIGPYKHSGNEYNNGFFVQFNFEVGFKKYYFIKDGFILMAPSSTVTSAIQVSSADSVAAYNDGYNAGKTDGYNNGFTDGEKKGKNVGYNDGYSAGYLEGRETPEYSFKEFFIGLGDAFVTIWSGMLNFEFLGVNIAGLIGTILVVCLVIFIVKIVKGV